MGHYWLQSDAFGLTSSRAPEYERLINDASELVRRYDSARSTGEDLTQELQKMNSKLLQALDPTDSHMIRWNYFYTKAGLIK